MVTGPWRLADLDKIPRNGLKVFSCFHCGGGSTMGYKLAGYDVLGGVEIDPEMMAIYRRNFNPRFSYLEGVQEFLARKELPAELMDLDVLDGSPPCSSFSMAGNRDEDWGKKKKFREGQADQVLDELFFDFIAIAKRLRPKVVIAENVKGMLIGKARGYTKRILETFREAGYVPQGYLLNSSRMGVPQSRERLFFIARRRDLALEPIFLSFNEHPITFAGLKAGSEGPGLSASHLRLWKRRVPSDKDLGDITTRADGKQSNWNHKFLHPSRVPLTITASIRPILYEEPRHANDREIIRIQTFPEDYDFMRSDPGYVCGMSVPPFMMQRLAAEICEQWFRGGSARTRSSGGAPAGRAPAKPSSPGCRPRS